MCMRMSARPCLCRSRPRPTGTRSKPSILSVACLACCREVIGMAQATVKCHLCGRSFQKPVHEVRQHNFCCAAHARKWNAGRMTEYNRTANPLNKPGGVVSSRRKHREKLSGKVPGRLTGNFMADTSIAWRRKPCWAGPCGPERSFIIGTGTS